MFEWTVKKCESTERPSNDGCRFSHCFLVTVPFAGQHEQVQEASLEVSLVSLQSYRDDPNALYEIYAIKGVDATTQVASLTEMWLSYEEMTYGWSQIAWFMWRALNNIIGRTIKGERNWFPSGVICSGLVYRFLENLWKKYNYSLFRMMLSTCEWDDDTVWPADIYKIVKQFPQSFQLVERKDSTGIHTYGV